MLILLNYNHSNIFYNYKKKSSTKRKSSNDNESSDNWQDHEIDLLLGFEKLFDSFNHMFVTTTFTKFLTFTNNLVWKNV